MSTVLRLMLVWGRRWTRGEGVGPRRFRRWVLHRRAQASPPPVPPARRCFSTPTLALLAESELQHGRNEDAAREPRRRTAVATTPWRLALLGRALSVAGGVGTGDVTRSPDACVCAERDFWRKPEEAGAAPGRIPARAARLDRPRIDARRDHAIPRKAHMMLADVCEQVAEGGRAARCRRGERPSWTSRAPRLL